MALSGTFRSLHTRNFRLLFIGQLVSIPGTWAQLVAQSWLVLQLTDDNAVAVGAVTALQTAPMLLFGLWGGLLADRFDKRRLIIVCQAAMGVTAAVLAVVTLAGFVQVWMVYLSVVVTGLFTVPDFPARQAFVVEVVELDELRNAVSLNSALFNAGRLVGPAIAGVLLAVADAGTCFAVNAVSYAAVVVALAAMRTRDLHRHQPVARAKRQVRQGLRYVWATPALRANIMLCAVMGSLGLIFQPVMPVLAKVTYGGSATTFSLMAAAVGGGAMLGALVLASHERQSSALLFRSALAFGVAIALAAAAPTLVLTVALLVVTGWFMITALSTSNALVQLDAEPPLRGRVAALRGVVVVGGAPVGGLVGGWLSEALNPRWAIAVGGLATVASAVALGPTLLGRHSSPAVAGAPGPLDPDAGAVETALG